MLAERANAALAQRFDAALTNMPLGLAMFDAAGRLAVVNGRIAALAGVAPEAIPLGLSAEDFARTVLAPGETTLAGGRILQRTDHPVADGGTIAIVEDVTERRQAEARVLYMATHDALTGLANRAELMTGLARRLTELREPAAILAVLYLDLDYFKSVNDTQGHAAGDALLKFMADRLRATAGPDDLVGRLGGDEFAVVQRVASAEAAVDLARRLVAALDRPGEQGGSGVSIGLALAPGHGLDADQLLACADAALYAAKAAGKGRFRLYEPAMEPEARIG
jgi:diguanylate cyclase (GGDEF)-like protein